MQNSVMSSLSKVIVQPIVEFYKTKDNPNINLFDLIQCHYCLCLHSSFIFKTYYDEINESFVDAIYVTGDFKKYKTGDDETSTPELYFGLHQRFNKRVMLVGKYPGVEEKTVGVAFIGRLALQFISYLFRPSQLEEIDLLYATNYCRVFTEVNYDSYKSKIGKDLFHVLLNEVNIIRPQILICVPIGSFANQISKFLGIKKRRQYDILIGKIPPLYYNEQGGYYNWWGEGKEVFPEQEVKVIFIPFKFETQAQRSVDLAFSQDIVRKEENWYKKYQVITDSQILEEVLLKYKDCDLVALDCEWFGRHYCNKNSYLRTIQLAFSDDCAYILEIHDRLGNRTFKDLERAVKLLDDYLSQPGRRILGTFIYTDAIWLKSIGLDILKHYKEESKILDAAAIVHAVDENAKYGLCEIVQRYLDIPRWDEELEEWCEAEKKSPNIPDQIKSVGNEYIMGYAPNEILYPYAAADVILLKAIAPKLLKNLADDGYGNNCEIAARNTIKYGAVLSEMMDTGVYLNKDFYRYLKAKVDEKINELLQATRNWMNWEDFDPLKQKHRMFLFYGEKYVKNSDRPQKARSLTLTPIRFTGKVKDNFDQNGENKYAKPSTDKVTCGLLLSQENLDPEKAEIVRNIFYFNILNQIRKGILGKKGLYYYLNDDGRIRSFFSPSLKTGRVSSSKPNLQNLSKGRDEDISRILGEKIRIRSLLSPEPGKTAIITADLVSAELYCTAIMSQDELLFEHCRRSALPEDHPDHYDIHSNLAVEAFRLNCAPTKKALEENGYAGLRVVAKSIVYGTNYGRSAISITRELRARGVTISEMEVNDLIDAFQTKYPKMAATINELRKVPLKQRWTKTFFQRVKRFPSILDGDNEYSPNVQRQIRECVNFHFQSTVADAMANILFYIWKHPRKEEIGYKLILTIHDELWIECPKDKVEETLSILHEAVESVKIAAWDENGRIIGTTYYPFLYDYKVLISE